MRIALTPGEPAGIGPDICLQIARQRLPADITVIADPNLLRERARMLNLTVPIVEYRSGSKRVPAPAGSLSVLAVERAHNTICGSPDPANARYVLNSLDTAVQGCLAGEFDAMVTGPVHKSVINKAGIRFSGHTEYLADLTQTPDVVMMLATAGLRVALVTTHLALKDVFAAITPHRIEAALRVTRDGLRNYFGIDRPRLLVCGLNPHAGEEGELGMEEVEIITPVIGDLIREGLCISGPRPADTAFLPTALSETDAVVAMYHDQGLPVLKHMGFGEAVNVTLGLPIIRTSVDHGTALELAGTGRAHTGSLLYALQTAIDMASSRNARMGSK